MLFLTAWLGISFYKDRLCRGRYTWVPAWAWMGCDFEHNYFSSRLWLKGGNPYLGFFKRIWGIQDRYVYPPVVLALFSWTGLLPLRPAYLIWLLACVGITVWATLIAFRVRQSLHLWKVPLMFALAAILGSYPILFELERGNCNLLALLFMILGWWALRQPSWKRDLVGGICLALGSWIKIYPGILLLGLLFFRRWRAAAVFCLAGLVIGLVDVEKTAEFAVNLHWETQRIIPNDFGFFFHNSHTLPGHWKLICRHVPIPGLAKVPGWAGWAGLILPAILWVSFRVSRSPNRQTLEYPYWLWLTAAGTFLPLGANDYNFFFLPLAALAVWDRRDPVKVHLLMALMLLWWQPLNLKIGATFFWLCKLIGLYATAWCLVNRTNDQAAAVLENSPEPQQRLLEKPMAA